MKHMSFATGKFCSVLVNADVRVCCGASVVTLFLYSHFHVLLFLIPPTCSCLFTSAVPRHVLSYFDLKAQILLEYFVKP